MQVNPSSVRNCLSTAISRKAARIVPLPSNTSRVWAIVIFKPNRQPAQRHLAQLLLNDGRPELIEGYDRTLDEAGFGTMAYSRKVKGYETVKSGLDGRIVTGCKRCSRARRPRKQNEAHPNKPGIRLAFQTGLCLQAVRLRNKANVRQRTQTALRLPVLPLLFTSCFR